MTEIEAESPWRATPLRVLFAIYTAAILAVTMWPKPVTEGSNRAVIDRVLAVSHDAGIPAAFDFHSLQVVANIAMFVPFGLLLALCLVPRLVWVAVVTSLALTCTIELVQQIFLPERSGDFWDVVANTAGGTLGAALVVGIRTLGSPKRPTQTTTAA